MSSFLSMYEEMLKLYVYLFEKFYNLIVIVFLDTLIDV